MTGRARQAGMRHCLFGGVIALMSAAGPAVACEVSVDLSTRPYPVPVPVQVSLRVRDFREINESDGSFTADFEMILTWRDDRLDSAISGFDTACPPSPDAIWSPPIQITNFVSVLNEPVALREIGADGRIVEWRRYLAALTADFDLARFPFDAQTLHFELQLFRGRPRDVALAFVNDASEVPGEAAGWKVGRMTSQMMQLRLGGGLDAPEVAGMIIEIPIRRQWFGPFISIYLPNFGCTLVALSVYFLPSDDGGNRIALSSTAMLIAAAFAFVMSDYVTGSLSPIDLFFWASILIPFVSFVAALVSIPLVARGKDWIVLRMDQGLLVISSAAFLWLTIFVWFRP